MGRITAKQQSMLTECKEVLSEHYPKLHLVETNPRIVVRGVFPVYLEQQVLDQFLIVIVFPQDYVNDIPRVKELGNRLPHKLERHILDDGHLCLFVRDERWKYWNPQKGIACFLSEALNDFFLSQLYYERFGRFPFGGRGHGLVGITEYYGEELETNDPRIVFGCLDFLARDEVKGHWRCFCGSNRRLRNCHGEKLYDLRRKITSSEAQFTLRLFLDAIKAAHTKR